MDRPMKFRKGNRTRYGHDFKFHTGVPSDVNFSVELVSEHLCKLTACGYGCLERHTPACYGNGAIHVYPDSRLRKRLEEALAAEAAESEGE